MAYAVAFFGVSWPDRVIRSRLFKWILRGPVTASVALALMTAVRRTGALLGVEYSEFVPLTMVGTVLLLEHGITLLAPLWERYLFAGADRAELQLFQNIEERLVTQGDLQQFLEAVLAAVRDHMHSAAAFVAALDDNALSLIVTAGNRANLDQAALTNSLPLFTDEEATRPDENSSGIDSGCYLCTSANAGKWTVTKCRRSWECSAWLDGTSQPIDPDQRDALWLLAERAALALEDRRLQQRVFRSLEDLGPKVDMIQRMRAAGRYDTTAALLGDALPPESDLANWVKDALTHYWGGPKLTRNPLMRLQIAQQLLTAHDGNYGQRAEGAAAQGRGPGQARRGSPVHDRMDPVQHPRDEVH